MNKPSVVGCRCKTFRTEENSEKLRVKTVCVDCGFTVNTYNFMSKVDYDSHMEFLKAKVPA